MSQSTPADARLIYLLNATLDGALTAIERTELARILHSDSAAKRLYCRWMSLHVLLDASLSKPLDVATLVADWPLQTTSLSAPVLTEPTLGRGRRLLISPLAWSIAGCAALFLVYFVTISWNMLGKERLGDRVAIAVGGVETPNSSLETRNPKSEIDAVATIRDTANAHWLAPEAGLPPAIRDTRSPVRSGERMRIESGIVELQLSQGATLLVEGPAEWQIDNQNAATLHHGKLVARVPKQAVGFMVTTPTASIVDLGTEFGVEVDTQGGSRVLVLQGEVKAVAIADPAASQRLITGEGVRIDGSGVGKVSTSGNFSEFTRTLAGPVAPAASRKLVTLPIETITAGSERADLVANGNFDQRGSETPPGTNAFPAPEVWQRVGDMFVAAPPESVTLPAHCGRWFAQANINGNAMANAYHQWIILEPDTEYVLSAYVWNFGDERHRLTAVVDLNDAPDEPQLMVEPPTAKSRGFFAYQSFDTGQTGAKIELRLFTDNMAADDANWPYRYLGAAWDRVAITPASKFTPPTLRKEDRRNTTNESN